ncbi:hypothetical protein RMN57_02480 [Kitasatospora sp. CM 4170]|uniref:Uncharacterized protein n=1 Tax=Kitasatospora aburaviensis TaxID=67265 RepID=A0ABW1EWS4_9ACTN|nr:hypothetical protein [Kitasatospora sp. CM 4170]WNM43646.1 hypothetical protein RMN57_02480 [Kitasatospora sp. CM 4170]
MVRIERRRIRARVTAGHVHLWTVCLKDRPQRQGEVLEMFVGGTARLLVTNDGAAPLALTVEPWAD